MTIYFDGNFFFQTLFKYIYMKYITGIINLIFTKKNENILQTIR